MNLEFLGSNRFWALVIGSLGVAAEGGFTLEAWLKGLSFLVGGFVTVATADKVGEKIGRK